MATKETRRQRGERRGRTLVARVLGEIRDHRLASALSQHQVAGDLGWSQGAYSRFEGGRGRTSLTDLAAVASVLGYEVSVGLHPIGDPIRDKGQLELGRRFDALLSDRWRVTDETLLPGPGELRAWDKLLRLREVQPRHLVGTDLETRVRDVQELVRRTRLRERDGGVDAILIVLSDSANNRRLVGQLRQSLGPAYATSPRAILAALRAGRLLPGSGVLLV